MHVIRRQKKGQADSACVLKLAADIVDILCANVGMVKRVNWLVSG